MLSIENIKKVLADFKQIDHWYYPLFTIWLRTGLRNAQIRGLAWDCIHWFREELLICKALRSVGLNSIMVSWAPTKTGHERVVPMSPEAKETQLRQKNSLIEKGIYAKQALAFVTKRTHRPIYDEKFGKQWKRSLERYGVKHSRLYSQRHSFLSHALAIGNSPAYLAQVGGHSEVVLYF